jgi:hypothetical protein
MSRASVDQLIDFDNREVKRRFVAFAGALTGIYSVDMKPRRDTRSLKQNAGYFVTVVEPLFQYLKDQEYNVTCRLQAHEHLKQKCNMVDIKSEKTGEILDSQPGDTHDLSIEEFGDYWERCRVYVWDRFGIMTEEPDPDYRNREPEPARRDARQLEARAFGSVVGDALRQPPAKPE